MAMLMVMGREVCIKGVPRQRAGKQGKKRMIFREVVINAGKGSAGAALIIGFVLVLTAWLVIFGYTIKYWAADYSFNTIKLVGSIFASPSVILGILILVALVLLIFYKKTKGKELGFAAVIFILPYLLISNLILPVSTPRLFKIKGH